MRLARNRTRRGSPGPRRSISIGVPRGLHAISYEPLWRSFLLRLGFTVEAIGPAPGRAGGGRGVGELRLLRAHDPGTRLREAAPAPWGVDYVFAPTITNEREGPAPDRSTFRRRENDSAFCYYLQYLPTVVGNTAFDTGRAPHRALPSAPREKR